MDIDRIARSDIKIVVDAAHGTASHILADLVGQLGIETLVVNAGIDDSHPTETADERVEALSRLGQLVRSSQANFGARFDPVGERLTLVNDLGETVDDARAVLVQLLLAVRHHRGGHIVLPVTASRTAETVAAAYGARVKWASTSPAALAKAAAAPGVIFAGDGAGGYMVPGTGAPFDGAAALVCLVSHLAGSAEPLSRLESQLPQDHVLQREITTPWSVKGVVMRHIAETGGDHVLDTTTDGVRIIEPDGGWALVLPDQSQAITRVYAEGSSQKDSQRLLAKWTDRVVEAVG
ncbi:hypothetical protein [Streptomyces sp. NPDC055287]